MSKPTTTTATPAASITFEMKSTAFVKSLSLTTGSRLRRLFLPREVAAGGLGIGRPHRRLAHEHRVDAYPLELLHVRPRADAGLRHDGLPRGNVGQELERHVQVDREGREVAV